MCMSCDNAMIALVCRTPVGVLCPRSAENRVTIAAAGAIAPLVALLGSPSEDVQKKAAFCLGYLAFNGALACCPVRFRAVSVVHVL